MLALAASGAEEGLWLRAGRQTAGRGRQNRAWSSPAGNFFGSTLVRLRPTDPAAASLALVAAVALHETVAMFHPAGDLRLKWPNDLLLGSAKLAGVLLERAGDAVVVGIGVNLAHFPQLPDRPATSLAAWGKPVAVEPFAQTLGDAFDRWLARWRSDGLAPVRAQWLARAHCVNTALTARLPDGTAADGVFEGLDADGALILRLASGERRVIHAGDVFLL
jgi:BirA family biotin operon repressor/biotin-[acetyl-CoA-carboxylase] ligase